MQRYTAEASNETRTHVFDMAARMEGGEMKVTIEIGDRRVIVEHDFEWGQYTSDILQIIAHSINELRKTSEIGSLSNHEGLRGKEARL